MCRSIRPLRGRAAPPATEGDVRDAARQYVRKVAAMRPAARDAAAFEAAVDEIAGATARLLAAMGSPPVPGPATPPSAQHFAISCNSLWQFFASCRIQSQYCNENMAMKFN